MKTKALIIGGGMAGLSLGLLLAESGLPIVLVDTDKVQPLAEAVPSGRTVALMDNSLNVIRACGIWDKIAHTAAPLKAMRLIDDNRTPPVTVRFDATEAGLEAFGYNIPNDILRAALVDAAHRQKNLTYLAPARLKTYRVDHNQVEATLEDGMQITADLIVGCDGRKSAVRAGAGIDAKIHDYGQMAITCLISHSKDHQNISTEHHRPGGPFTFVPMPGRQSSVVWVEKTQDAKKFMALPRPLFEKTLQGRSNALLGKIKLESNPESWSLMLLSADRLTAPRTAIAAEAAHVLSPIGAQGLNLSLRDIAALAETIVDAARLGEDIGAEMVLGRYAARRSLDLETRVRGVDLYNRAVANDLGFIASLRRFGLLSLDKFPALKTLAMHQGLLPALDDSRLLKGQAL